MKNLENNPDFTQRMLCNPRNLWSKLLAVLDLGKTGDFLAADALLESFKYHPELSPDVLGIFQKQLTQLKGGKEIAPKVNIPADFTAHKGTAWHPGFRTLRAGQGFPMPYPADLALPGIVGAQNDCSFIQRAATGLAHRLDDQDYRVHIIYSAQTGAGLNDLLTGLQQQSFDGHILVTAFAEKPLEGVKPAGDVVLEVLAGTILQAKAQAALTEISETADLVVFLDGVITLDDTAIERAVYMARVSDRLVQPLVQMAPGKHYQTPFSTRKAAKAFSGRFPYRDIKGMNLAVPATFLRRVGLPDPRFSNLFLGAREFAFRLYNLGGYFSALTVPGLKGFEHTNALDENNTLYIETCPNHWDRKSDGRFKTPKVSIYIPTYNASKYIERAVESVLAQDVQDLEVCLSDDGSKDNTLEILKRRYGDEPKVRFVANQNGGIGFASNQAITMSRGIYVGQLDSDDCLKPGAVRRLMDYLDENPDTACCYGSCERIDADDNYTMDEYSWPKFRREKMMVTSIVHHFRMFRRAAWERTTHFREDIQNAVDYDVFLKLSEVGRMHHIEEILYQRRWHGENTSNVNEGFQTSNTYRVQTEALARMGLSQFWDVHLPDPERPRYISYRREAGTKQVLFWPDYSRPNPYQKLLYGATSTKVEYCAGKIEAAVELIKKSAHPEDMVFHLHWLNFVFNGITEMKLAKAAVEDFMAKLETFKKLGGQVVWTIHNVVSHDTPFYDLEIDLSNRIAALADTIHFHSENSISEVAEKITMPRDKIRICRHGNYLGVYPDFVTKQYARKSLGLKDEDEVILFSGQVRPYKGVNGLIGAFRNILADRPKALLLIAGAVNFDLLGGIEPALSDFERSRIIIADRFLDDMELQLFFRAADMAIYPYRSILTSGSLLLALSFGLPVAIPKVGMTRDVLEGSKAGVLYDGADPEALQGALQSLLACKDDGSLQDMAAAAADLAAEQSWESFEKKVLGVK